jgi:hypothetical protein
MSDEDRLKEEHGSYTGLFLCDTTHFHQKSNSSSSSLSRVLIAQS